MSRTYSTETEEAHARALAVNRETIAEWQETPLVAEDLWRVAQNCCYRLELGFRPYKVGDTQTVPDETPEEWAEARDLFLLQTRRAAEHAFLEYFRRKRN